LLIPPLTGLNDAGQVVGLYTDALGRTHGFIASPIPEPSPLTLLGIGVINEAADKITPVIVPALVLGDKLTLLCAGRPVQLGGRIEKKAARTR
jgi:hypothetical protein